MSSIGTLRLAFSALAVLAACASPFELHKEKLAPRLYSLLTAGTSEHHYEVVITMSDSSNVSHVVKSVSISSRSVATGNLTREEIRRLIELKQIVYVDLSKSFYPLHP